MSETNNLDFYRIVSVATVAFVISLIIVIVMFPIFSGNYFYEIGTIMIFSGKLSDIPYGWQICNGQNGTPDLRNKFIIGAWNGDIPLVEKKNNINVIGYGINSKYVDNYKKAKQDNVVGLMDGNIHYLFGQNIKNNNIYSNTDTNDNFDVHYDKGSSWFKEYKIKNMEICKLKSQDEGGFEKTDDKDITTYNYDNDDNTTRKGHFYSKSESDNSTLVTDLCDGSGINDYILNDANLINKQLKYSTTSNPDDNYNFYVNLNDNITLPTKNNKDYSTNLVEHSPGIKRRLFRDYEDYKLYLKLDESCYDCLPMNHKFTYNYYNRDVRIGTQISEIYLIETENFVSNNITIVLSDDITNQINKDDIISITTKKFMIYCKVNNIDKNTINVTNDPDNSVNDETLQTEFKNNNVIIIVHEDVKSYLNNNQEELNKQDLIIKNNKVLHQRFMNDFVYEKPYNNNPSYYKLAYIIRVK